MVPSDHDFCFAVAVDDFLVLRIRYNIVVVVARDDISEALFLLQGFELHTVSRAAGKGSQR